MGSSCILRVLCGNGMNSRNSNEGIIRDVAGTELIVVHTLRLCVCVRETRYVCLTDEQMTRRASVKPLIQYLARGPRPSTCDTEPVLITSARPSPEGCSNHMGKVPTTTGSHRAFKDSGERPPLPCGQPRGGSSPRRQTVKNDVLERSGH